MKRDYAREDLPGGALWNLVDILPEVLDGRGRKRGGYEYASQAISAVSAGTAFISAGIFAPFSNASSLIVFGDDGRAYEIESATATENIGATDNCVSPAFYNNMVICPDGNGNNGPKKITRSGGAHSVAALSGSPPAGRYPVVFKDVLWLASPALSADRIFFSIAGNPESWDTTNRWLDVSFPITGMAAMQNAVFVFGKDRTARVRGSVPPPDTDFIVDDPIFDIGCTDHRSITLYRDKLVWANANGIYITDGSVPEDLTRICGMKSWWLDVMGGLEGFAPQGGGAEGSYSDLTWSIVTEVYGDFLVYSVMNGAVEVDSGIIDLIRYSWFRARNLDAISAFRRPYPEEVFFGRRGSSHVAKVSSLFNPTSSTKADADGTNVLPEFETGYFLSDSGLKAVRRVFLAYDLRDSGSDNPTLTVSYIDSPEETSYTAADGGTLPETSAIEREHRFVNQPVRGIAFKVAQSNPSSDTRFYELAAEFQPRGGYH